jgi:hypothetical protein
MVLGNLKSLTACPRVIARYEAIARRQAGYAKFAIASYLAMTNYLLESPSPLKNKEHIYRRFTP